MSSRTPCPACGPTGARRCSCTARRANPPWVWPIRGEVLERLDQLERLDSYIDQWFKAEDGSFIGAFHQFADAEQLESMLLLHLRKLIDRWLVDQEAG